MLNREVKIGDTIYRYHYLIQLGVTVGYGIVALVRSCETEDIETSAKTEETQHELSYTDEISVASIEQEVWNLPFFDEYEDSNTLLDEVLNILTDEQAIEVPDAFHSWKPDTTYTVGYRVRWNSALYKCLIAHTSVKTQSPDVAVSLWAKMVEPGTIPVWVQPDSTNPYMKGDKVHFPTASDPVYVSVIDYNVFAPNVAGWELEGGE